jgi:hypothetical protein
VPILVSAIVARRRSAMVRVDAWKRVRTVAGRRIMVRADIVNIS